MLRLPHHIRRRPLAFVGRTILRAIAATCLGAAVTTLAASGTYFTTASESVSLAFEPFSLLLTPGLFCGMLMANVTEHLRGNRPHATTHDYTPQAVLAGSLVFYSIFFFYALLWWSRRRAARAQTAPGTSR